MKTLLAIGFLGLAALATVSSQNAAPAARTTTTAELLQNLQLIKDQNIKILDQQAKASLRLEELEKTAQTVRTFAKRS